MQVLGLQSCELNDMHAKLLARGVRHLSALRELDLGFNEVGSVGVAKLAPTLAALTAMRRCKLAFNLVGDRGASALATAVKSWPVLDWLTLNANPLCDQGLRALARAAARISRSHDREVNIDVDDSATAHSAHRRQATQAGVSSAKPLTVGTCARLHV